MRLSADNWLDHSPMTRADWLTIAYEPVWAIGTGRVPTTSGVEEMHSVIRSKLGELMQQGADAVRFLYSGSMNGGNAAELLAVPNVDGGLVGVPV